MVREIIVVKKPRDGVLQDRPINFPALHNLHLDLVENKKKLKKNIPLVQVKKPQPAVAPVAKAKPYSAEVMAGLAPPDGKAAKSSASSTSKTKSKKEKLANKESDEGENDADADAMAEELAGDDADVPEDADDEAETSTKDAVVAGLSAAAGVAAGAALADGADAEAMGPEGAPDAREAAEGAGEAPVEEDDPYAGLSPEEREAKEREEYIWRFRILKKQYRNRNIPEFTEHDDVSTMKITYDRTVREIGLETNLENYRMYLIGGFMAIEFASTNWMGIDLSGFYTQQMLMMDKYDRLLIELGEKSYTRWGSNLPVELRLLGFIILQAGLFYLGKIIADKAGSSVAELFKNITGQPVAPATKTATGARDADAAPEPAPKKKMRGPSVKVSDLRSRGENVATPKKKSGGQSEGD